MSWKLKKTYRETIDKLETNKSNEFDFEKARHEVFKFGISGLSHTDKREAKIAHAISLGAVARKGKNKNYKQLTEERKAEKRKQNEDKEQQSTQMSHKTSIYKKKKLKSTKNPNDVKGFDYQIGKYRNGVQFVDKKQIKSSRRKK
ncbi:uncharacterized protein C1orf131-like [Oppia nitens]|uniref:uncharacterized protein C1orf131-like n=1 Tax=Oppia nitens TaxID=1686743 RepID=UPI0023DB98B7|nr:uncharacterized protein C1orf131-like [Oppia nitens]